MTQEPDEIVVEKIASEFLKYGLIEEAEIEDFAHKLSDGQMSSEDWQLMAELSIKREEGTENAQTA
jgi:hypothetical protein